MRKVHFFVDDYNTFEYLRVELPCRHLESILGGHGVQLSISNIKAETAPMADAYVFGNCVGPETVGLVERYSRIGRIIWQIDDDFFNIPTTSYSYGKFRQIDLQALEYCFDLSTLIFTTTDHLKKRLGREKKTLVVPNLVDINDYPEWEPRPNGDVLWQGTLTHLQDLEELGNVADLLPNRKFIFLGQLPPQYCGVIVSDNLQDIKTYSAKPNVGLVNPVACWQYPQTIRQLAARSSIGLCPLKDIEFNKSKSPLKYLEFAALNLSVVGSKFDDCPYNVIQDKQTGFQATTPEEWATAIESCSPEVARAGHEWVRDNLSWQSEAARDIWINALLKAATYTSETVIKWGKNDS